MNTETIIQEVEFKAGVDDELLLFAQSFIEAVAVDLYASGGAAGTPSREEGLVGRAEIERKLEWEIEMRDAPAGETPTKSKKESGARGAVMEETPKEGDVSEQGPARMYLLYTNRPEMGWKRWAEIDGDFSGMLPVAARFVKLVHPEGVPFEGKVVVVTRSA